MTDRVAYWLDLCDYDLSAARALLTSRHYLYVGFMCHQSVEKAMKAFYSSLSDEIPPKIHSLHKLAALSGLREALSCEMLRFIDRLEPLNIEARYPEHKERLAARLTVAACTDLIAQTEAFIAWIRERL